MSFDGIAVERLMGAGSRSARPMGELRCGRRACRALGTLAVVVWATACGAPRSGPVPPPGRGPAARATLVRLVLPGGRVRAVALDGYVAGVISAEMWAGVGASPRLTRAALELQALLSRTFALAHPGRHAAEGADLCTTTHCQVWRAPAGPEAVAATRATAGLVLTHEGRPIQALYHADCGGATSSAETIWGGAAPPYLAGGSDGVCRRLPPRAWDLRLSAEALVAALDASPRTRVNGRLDGIRILELDAAGRARLVLLSGAASPVVRGEELRMAVGPARLRSARFSVAREGAIFVFHGSGFGHGAGLCQRGAVARLAGGASVAEVLRHYFPDVRIAGT